MSRPGTDLGVHAGGELLRYVDQVARTTYSPAAAYTVGGSLIVLTKDEFTSVEFSDLPPAWAEAMFGDVKVTFVEGQSS
jgi:hypothetical protein